MKEIVWVLGHSGVGKETFCRSIVQNPDSYIAKQLGWTRLMIGLCDSSVDLVPRGHNKKKKDDRDKIIDELKDKQDILDVVLLKWQALDSQKGRVKAINAVFHNATIRALVLQAEDRLVEERHQSRESAWKPSEGWESFLGHENEVIKTALSDFQVIDYVDTNNGYELIKVPVS
jgi:hypothetical protein